MVGQLCDYFGHLDILVNCAGVMHPAPIVSADPADWKQMIEVNLLGTLHACRAALPVMKQQGSGTIINVSSTSGRTPSPNFSVYVATKFGLGAFTEVLRKEAHPDVRVCVFEPGPTNSELATNISDPDLKKWAEDYMAGMDALEPEDVAEALVFVCTRPQRIAVNEVLFRPTNQRDW
jgi:NADP-dependent 3-hydroxy acid dehydrogenase YdfG